MLKLKVRAEIKYILFNKLLHSTDFIIVLNWTLTAFEIFFNCFKSYKCSQEIKTRFNLNYNELGCPERFGYRDNFLKYTSDVFFCFSF